MLTVLVPSHNGGETLRRTMERLCELQTPTGGWKLIVIDNASTDGTDEIAHAYRARLPLLVLQEPQAGKNRALNRGLREAEGDLFVFCDDDMLPCRDWLVRWREVADMHSGFDLFAGIIEPEFPAGYERAAERPVEPGVAFGDNSHNPEGPCEPIAMFGANMAIRASVFRDGVEFDPDIGPNGSRIYAMGSETELARRLGKMNFRCWFARGPRAKHIVRPEQLDPSSVFLRGYRSGKGSACMDQGHHYGPYRLRIKNLLRWSLYPLLMRYYSEKEAWQRQWEWAFDQGYEDGCRERRQRDALWLRGQEGPRVARRFRKAGRKAREALGAQAGR